MEKGLELSGVVHEYGRFMTLSNPNGVIENERKLYDKKRRQVALILVFNPNLHGLAFLLPRCAQEDGRGNHNPIQGGILSGEPLFACCARELSEEIGLSIPCGDLRYLGSELQRCTNKRKHRMGILEQHFHAVFCETRETALVPREDGILNAAWIRFNHISSCVLAQMSVEKHSIFSHALVAAATQGLLPYYASEVA